MNMINGLDHIGIRVKDFQSTIAFYKQLGFEVIREDFNERVVVLTHTSGISLNLLDSAIKLYQELNILMDETIKYPGYTHIGFRVADIEQAVQSINTLDIAITEGPVTFGDGKTSIFIRDPDRNVIEFTQLPMQNNTQSNFNNSSNQGAAK